MASKASKKSSFIRVSKSPKRDKVESVFTLSELNISKLDKDYALPEISKKQEREIIFEDDTDIKSVTTSLEQLGISSVKKEPIDVIVWGEHYNVQLFVNDGGRRYDLHPGIRIKCHWCTLLPKTGSLMLAVPYKYVPSYLESIVYSPECCNIVTDITVGPNREEKKKIDAKSAPRINSYRRDIVPNDQLKYNNSMVKKDYFECCKPVCSFSCMLAMGRILARNDPRFRNVEMNIIHLYMKIFGNMPKDPIIPSPSYEILEEYGGTFTEEEYRSNLQRMIVENTSQVFVNLKRIIHPVEQLYVMENN
jgi:hypothetical protein